MWHWCDKSCDCHVSHVTVLRQSCDGHVKFFSHLNSVDLDSEMETISFSEDLPSPMSLVHVAHLQKPSASFPGPHPRLAVQVGVHFLMWVMSWVEILQLIAGKHDYNIVSHVTWPYTFHRQHTSCVCERSCHMRAWICRATAQRDQSTRWTLCPPNCLVKSDKKSPSCTAVIWLGIVALQCVRVGEVVCGLHDQIISPAGDVTQVRKCSRPSPS